MNFIKQLIPHISFLKERSYNDNDNLFLLRTQLYEKHNENYSTSCYSCKRTNVNVTLCEKPSLVRRSDEIIEIHPYCDLCR